MDLIVTLAVLCAACAHAIWNAFVKTGDDQLISITGIAAASTVISALIFPFAGTPHADSWPYILASIILHVAYMIALSQAYRYSDFSSAYPIARGTAPILVFAWSFVFLQEALSTREVLAVFGIIVGIMVFSTRRIGAVVSDKKAIFYALLTSLFIAAYTVVDGIGVRLSGTVNGYMVWMTFFEIFPLMLYTYIKRGPKVFTTLAANAKPMLLAGLMAISGYWIVIWAMTQAPIVLVAALRETSIIIAALIGTFYFKEPSGKRRIIAAIIVCISVAILRWPS
jgi:drug/metabolite transporter (DMT)-like permease